VRRAEPIALVTHVRAVPVAERERFARTSEQSLGEAGLVLRTCHRVEAYIVAEEVPAHLAGWLPSGGRVLVGEAAVRHAVMVATGRDSVVIGEDQVLHQLRTTLALARLSGRLDPSLERLMSLSLRAGRRARSWRQGPAISLADVALRAIERQVGPLHGRQLLVVGAGQMGRLAARAGADAGAMVVVANRSVERATALARSVGGQPAPFDPGDRLADVAAVVVAIDGPWVISPHSADMLAAGRAMVVDLSVPPAVSPELAGALGPRSMPADALATTNISEASGEAAPSGRLETLIESTVAEFLTWQRGRESRDIAGLIAARAERERDAELARLFQRLPGLDVGARDAISEMSRHLAARLLREPFERLGEDPDGGYELAARRLFGL
jgi:glutamyl-tRNA reductase